MAKWSVDGGIDEIPVAGAPGRMWLCGKQYIGPDVHRAIAETGADTVVCLTQRHEVAERYPDYTAWLDTAPAEVAVWRPLTDLSYPSPEEIRPFLDDLVERLEAGRGLIIHCAAGIGRSGTTATALLMLLGASQKDATEVVRTHRRGAGPESGRQLHFIQALAAG